MDPFFRNNDNPLRYQKENSPPGGLEVHEQPGARISIPTADVFSLNNANQRQTAAFKSLQESVKKFDDNMGMYYIYWGSLNLICVLSLFILCKLSFKFKHIHNFAHS